MKYHCVNRHKLKRFVDSCVASQSIIGQTLDYDAYRADSV